MTSPEILAGNFLKSLLQNFPGEDNSIPEKSDHPQKESKNQNTVKRKLMFLEIGYGNSGITAVRN